MGMVKEGRPSYHINILISENLGILNGVTIWKRNDAKYKNLQFKDLDSSSFCSRNQTSNIVKEGKIT